MQDCSVVLPLTYTSLKIIPLLGMLLTTVCVYIVSAIWQVTIKKHIVIGISISDFIIGGFDSCDVLVL